MMEISREVGEKSQTVQALVHSSTGSSNAIIDELDALIERSHQSVRNLQTVAKHLDIQVQSSETIKISIAQIVEDTKKAIEGSATNMNLGSELIRELQKLKDG